MNEFLSSDDREIAVTIAVKLALAFLHSLADTQEKRGLLNGSYYSAEDLLVSLDAEASQLFTDAPGTASEVNHMVMDLLITKGAQSA